MFHPRNYWAHFYGISYLGLLLTVGEFNFCAYLSQQKLKLNESSNKRLIVQNLVHGIQYDTHEDLQYTYETVFNTTNTREKLSGEGNGNS